MMPLSCLLSCLFLLSTFTEVLHGFTADLFHRDSPFSATYNPSLIRSTRLTKSIRRSFSRIQHYNSIFASSSSESVQIIPAEGEYLMKISIGTPPVEVLGIADTGSDLIWTQCKPCTPCFKQNPPLFQPNQSSTYRHIPCTAKPCGELPQSGCDESNICHYSYSYGDSSYTRGSLAAETLTLGTTSSGKPLVVPKIVLGCGHENGGTFNEAGSGLIGLGGGPLSLVSQLGNSIRGKFSYCLVPLASEAIVTSKISFGSDGIVSGSGVVSTPTIAKDPNTFYFLTLEGISVGKKRLFYHNYYNPKALPGEQGNIIIDSGTTLTFLPAGFHDDLVSALESAITAERVKDPQGVLSLCYRGDESSIGVPTITAHFSGADVVLQPLNTFAKIEEDVICFTMVSADTNVAIFGNLAQMNFLVGYDLEAKTVSFKPADCTARA
ncbi:hypothetical protein UlMin_000964 [Ulmus minor]